MTSTLSRLTRCTAAAACGLWLGVCQAAATAPSAPAPSTTSAAALAAAADPKLKSAAADPGRSSNFQARDKARHPVEELTFFGIAPTMTVVELWPGGGYWTEILGPYLAGTGTYYVALPPPGDAEEDKSIEQLARAHGRTEGRSSARSTKPCSARVISTSRRRARPISC